MIATSNIVRRVLSTPATLSGVRGFASLDAYEDYGKHVFTGKVADTYLKKHGASGEILKDPSWTKNHADVVAAAVLDWYVQYQFNVFTCRAFFVFISTLDIHEK